MEWKRDGWSQDQLLWELSYDVAEGKWVLKDGEGNKLAEWLGSEEDMTRRE